MRLEAEDILASRVFEDDNDDENPDQDEEEPDEKDVD
jgi:hypothetical protein